MKSSREETRCCYQLEYANGYIDYTKDVRSSTSFFFFSRILSRQSSIFEDEERAMAKEIGHRIVDPNNYTLTYNYVISYNYIIITL